MLGFALTALGAVRKAAGAAVGAVTRYPWPTALAVSLALSAWLWAGWNRADARTADCAAGRAADRAAYANAQVEAARLALAAKAATEARYKAHAERIDRDHETQLADARDATAEYIRTHRVRGPATTAEGSSGGPVTTASDHGSSGGERSSDAPFMVAVSESDIGVCTDNTLRLEAVRDWAIGLAK